MSEPTYMSEGLVTCVVIETFETMRLCSFVWSLRYWKENHSEGVLLVALG